MELLDAPDLARDPRFAEPAARMENREDLVEALSVYFSGDTTDAWMERLAAAGMPAGPVLDIAQMTKDPQAIARAMVQDIGAVSGSAMRVLGHPVKYSDDPAAIRRPAPALGQHTFEVLLEAGYEDEEIEALAASGGVLTGRTRPGGAV